ncbi:hypothetical protein FQN57_001466 [Myotisia sp. PD_48]|nr:hypothetical protein FQN57_001466 [Myotisia sp. PD_48]
MSSPSLESRIKGSIYGVAVVDALGGPVEFHARGRFPKVTDYQYNTNFAMPPGTWTDDTSLTLCLAKSLIDSKGEFVSQDAIRNYIKWYQNGDLSATGKCFDIGNCTRQALMMWNTYFPPQEKGIPEDAPNALVEGQKAVDKALKRKAFCGNGSLMRVAPIGLVFYRNLELALSNAALSSDVTHPYPVNAECCEIYTTLIVHCLNGATKTDLAEDIATASFLDPNITSTLEDYTDIDSWKAKDIESIQSSGYVIHTLEAALWAFFTTDTFQEGAIRVVNLGDDADTVGAVYGGLAGAYYGLENIPGKWLDGLQGRDIVEKIASDLASLHT